MRYQHSQVLITRDNLNLIYPIRHETLRCVDQLLKSIGCRYTLDAGNLLAVTRNEYVAQDDDLDVRTLEHERQYVNGLPWYSDGKYGFLNMI